MGEVLEQPLRVGLGLHHGVELLLESPACAEVSLWKPAPPPVSATVGEEGRRESVVESPPRVLRQGQDPK
eukprot:5663990-Heterocapsa_arctica.AAC.1